VFELTTTKKDPIATTIWFQQREEVIRSCQPEVSLTVAGSTEKLTLGPSLSLKIAAGIDIK